MFLGPTYTISTSLIHLKGNKLYPVTQSPALRGAGSWQRLSTFAEWPMPGGGTGQWSCSGKIDFLSILHLQYMQQVRHLHGTSTRSRLKEGLVHRRSNCQCRSARILVGSLKHHPPGFDKREPYLPRQWLEPLQEIGADESSLKWPGRPHPWQQQDAQAPINGRLGTARPAVPFKTVDVWHYDQESITADSSPLGYFEWGMARCEWILEADRIRDKSGKERNPLSGTGTGLTISGTKKTAVQH